MSPEEKEKMIKKFQEFALYGRNQYMIYVFTTIGAIFFGILFFAIGILFISEETTKKYDSLTISILLFFVVSGGTFGSKVWERCFQKWYIERLKRQNERILEKRRVKIAAKEEKRRAKEAAKKAKEEKNG